MLDDTQQTENTQAEDTENPTEETAQAEDASTPTAVEV